ncbi:hypothetical protein ACWX0K_25360 (plasmid) [Nitrobacteraceae bacterium UC4446_H13]
MAWSAQELDDSLLEISFVAVLVRQMRQVGDKAEFRWPVWLNASMLLIINFLAIGFATLRPPPGADAIAVAFPPWWSTQRVFASAASANTAIIRGTSIPSLLIVHIDKPGDLTRLRGAGVWLALDPQAIAACLRN